MSTAVPDVGLKIRIKGAEYPFPTFDTINYDEARFIKHETADPKRHARGLTMGEFFAALEEGDTDALFAIALVALQRADKTTDGLGKLLLDDIEIVAPEAPEVPLDVEPEPVTSEPQPDEESDASQS